MKKDGNLSTAKTVLFTGMSLLLVLVLAEGAIRLACLLPGIQAPRKICRFNSQSEGNEYDFVERKKRKKETEYGYDLYSPTLGWKNLPGFDADVEKPGMATYRVRINSKGVRSDREIPFEKDPEIFRVLVLGESQTFGEGVSNGQCYSDLLEAHLPGTEWINLAAHGYGNDQNLLTLQEEGRSYSPDLIVLGFLPSAIYRNTVSFRGFAKPMFVLEEGALKLTNVPVPSPEEVLERNRANPVEPDCSDLRNFSILYRFLHKAVKDAYLERSRYLESSAFLRSVYPRLKKLVKRFMKESPTAKKYKLQGKEWTLTQEIFLEIQRIAREDGAELLLVLYPGSSEAFEQEVKRFAREHDIRICDISPPFREVMKEQGPAVFSLVDGHWNARGHEMAARAIEACLRDQVPGIGAPRQEGEP